MRLRMSKRLSPRTGMRCVCAKSSMRRAIVRRELERLPSLFRGPRMRPSGATYTGVVSSPPS
eukprot:10140117-Alexandrium_andersonii.AAC.1